MEAPLLNLKSSYGVRVFGERRRWGNWERERVRFILIGREIERERERDRERLLVFVDLLHETR